MASAKLYLTNGVQSKVAPIGFSWTTFFFGCLPALIRGDWKWGLIQVVLAILTSGISILVFMFIYNKLYVKDLLDNGYTVLKIEGSTEEQIKLKLGLVSLPKDPEFRG